MSSNHHHCYQKDPPAIQMPAALLYVCGNAALAQTSWQITRLALPLHLDPCAYHCQALRLYNKALWQIIGEDHAPDKAHLP